jgi:hypothetical protein
VANRPQPQAPPNSTVSGTLRTVAAQFVELFTANKRLRWTVFWFGWFWISPGTIIPGASRLASATSCVTFMEKLGGGVVQTTTIANGGASVHSRHTVDSRGKFIASQSYGQCMLVQ